MAEIVAERHFGPTRKAVLKGLTAFNRANMETRVERRLAISLREQGAIVGGIVGECWTSVLFIELFWMQERFRGCSYGARLLEAIEVQAMELGAVRAYVDTMSFQAPGFYRKHGYQEFGRLPDYPGGVIRHWLTKPLVSPKTEGSL